MARFGENLASYAVIKSKPGNFVKENFLMIRRYVKLINVM